MSIIILMVPATLIAAIIESMPKRDRKIRHEWRRNDKRIVW